MLEELVLFFGGQALFLVVAGWLFKRFIGHRLSLAQDENSRRIQEHLSDYKDALDWVKIQFQQDQMDRTRFHEKRSDSYATYQGSALAFTSQLMGGRFDTAALTKTTIYMGKINIVASDPVRAAANMDFVLLTNLGRKWDVDSKTLEPCQDLYDHWAVASAQFTRAARHELGVADDSKKDSITK